MNEDNKRRKRVYIHLPVFKWNKTGVLILVNYLNMVGVTRRIKQTYFIYINTQYLRKYSYLKNYIIYIIN